MIFGLCAFFMIALDTVLNRVIVGRRGRAGCACQAGEILPSRLRILKAVGAGWASRSMTLFGLHYRST
jgi:hypothetical protein